MKKTKNNIITAATLLAGLLIFSLTSCVERFEKLNTNPNEITAEQMETNNYRTGTKVLALEGLVIPVQEHMYQFNEALTGGPFAGYTGSTVDTWLTRFETFNPSADWRKWPFANVITETYAPYRGIINSGDEMAMAFGSLMRVAIMHRVTDCYGPIPYTDILTNESIFVKYDSQETVYMKMFEELDAAIETLRSNQNLDASAWSNYDLVFYGNIGQWYRYANSLKLRMAMRLSEVKPELAKAKAAEAIAAGVIQTNTDNAAMHAVENRTTLLYNDWMDHRVGADIICYMNGYNDPRREKMFTKVKVSVDGESVDGYAGVRVGSDIKSKEAFINAYSNQIVNASTPYLWMNAAEVSFLMAEYELRWGDKAMAQELYENGVKLSFAERGAAGVEDYLADNTSKPASYTDPLGDYSVSRKPSEITIKWDDKADFETSLERIITQKWIAIYPLGVEGWSEYRRTGYPRLFDAPQDKSGGTVDLNHHARRLPYPVEEYQQNRENLEIALTLLEQENTGDRHGDGMGVRLWWDVKPYNN